MRIAQVAPLYEAVPPPRYGGTERVVYGLTEELTRRGHDVVLFGSGDSRTSARLVPCSPHALRADRAVHDPHAYTVRELGRVLAMADDFDIIHNHIDYFAFPYARLIRTPVVTTVHGRLDLPEILDTYRDFPDALLVSISDAQRAPLPNLRWLGTVYNGIDLTHFAPREEPGAYLAFLGRVSPEKGPDLAIQIARAVGMPLRIAAKIDDADRDYFDATIKPMLKDPGVEFVGEIDEAAKSDFLGRAYAYLFPIDWPEPFGITVVESLACGTPVIAMARGSVPEILTHGETGFLCQSVDEMIAAVADLPRIDRRTCRARAERFSVQRMTDGYEAIYRRALALTPTKRSA